MAPASDAGGQCLHCMVQAVLSPPCNQGGDKRQAPPAPHHVSDSQTEAAASTTLMASPVEVGEILRPSLRRPMTGSNLAFRKAVGLGWLLGDASAALSLGPIA